jgi:hypothetical protein
MMTKRGRTPGQAVGEVRMLRQYGNMRNHVSASRLATPSSTPFPVSRKKDIDSYI